MTRDMCGKCPFREGSKYFDLQQGVAWAKHLDQLIVAENNVTFPIKSSQSCHMICGLDARMTSTPEHYCIGYLNWRNGINPFEPVEKNDHINTGPVS